MLVAKIRGPLGMRALVRDVRSRHIAIRQRVFERAMERGEIVQADAATLLAVSNSAADPPHHESGAGGR
jgi:hypothetical protein